MSNFVYGLDCCCSLGERERDVLRVDREIALVKQDTGEVVNIAFGYPHHLPDGTVLIVKSKWLVKKNYDKIAEFDTEAEAQAELKRIVDELAKSNFVVQAK